jgi:hypothetical protein
MTEVIKITGPSDERGNDPNDYRNDPTYRSTIERMVGEAPRDDSGIPNLSELIIQPGELEAAKLTPPCIVVDHTFADLGQLVAPGGVGKTTLLLYESICIALGRDVWGMNV